MANVKRTAMGQMIDMDRLRLANESVIAVGNTRSNARGDQLGAGGQVVKTRAQIQQDYYKLNTPTADEAPVAQSSRAAAEADTTVNLLQPTAEDTPVVASSSAAAASTTYSKPRGSFAEAVAEDTEVKQELLEPIKSKDTTTGVKRI
jgi:hypothetical protein